MAKRNEHLVVVMLVPVALGEEFEIWERHITLVPWFPVGDEKRLDVTLKIVAGRHRKLSVKAGGVEEWGRKEKYPVQKIEDNGPLHELHLDVFNSLENNGFPIHQKDFMGDKYDPHVALRNRLQKGDPLPAGETMRVDKFSLVRQKRLKGSGRMIKSIVREYELG